MRLEIEEDFSAATVGGGFHEGGVDFAQRKGAMNRNVDRAIAKHFAEQAKDAVQLRGGFVAEPAAQPEAMETQAAEDEQAVGNLERLAGHGAVGDERTAGGEGVREIQGARPADGVQGEAGRGSVHESRGLGAQVGAVEDDTISAEDEQFVDELGAADDVERAEAEAAGELNDAAADAGVRGVLHDPIAGCESREVVQQRVGGGRIHRDHAGLLRIDAGGQGNDAVGRDVACLAPRAGAERCGEVAEAKRGDGRTEGGDAPDAFISEDREEIGELAVGTLDDVEVGGIDRRGQHFQAHLVGSGRREVEFVEGKDLGGPAEGVEAGGKHASINEPATGRGKCYFPGMDALQGIRGLVVDLDGTLYVGDEVLPGVKTALEALREAGMPMRFLTNTTSKPRSEIVARLDRMELGIAADEIFTAPRVAASILRQRGVKRAHFLLKAPVIADMEGIEPVEAGAEAVVIGDIGDELSPQRLNRAFRLLLDGAAFYALAENRMYRRADGMRLDVGAFVRALEYGSRRQATLLGKPAPAFFKTAVEALELWPEEVASIGDDLEGDVGGGQGAGLRGVLVRTGKFRAEDLRTASIMPDVVIDSFADVPAALLTA